MRYANNNSNQFPKLHLSLVLPHGCNLKCPFCILLKMKEVPHRTSHDLDSFMTSGSIRHFLCQAIERGRLPGGVEIGSIGIHGDECLNGLAADITKTVIETAADYGIRCNIVTNGTLFLRESSAFLRSAAPIDITVSLDSAYPMFCELLRGPGAGVGLNVSSYSRDTEAFREFAGCVPELQFPMSREAFCKRFEARGFSVGDVVEYEEFHSSVLIGIRYAAQCFKQHRLNALTVLQPPDAEVFRTFRGNLAAGGWNTNVSDIYAGYFESVEEVGRLLARLKTSHGNFGVWEINPLLDAGKNGEPGGPAPSPVLAAQLEALHRLARRHDLRFCVGTEFGLPEELYKQAPGLREVPVNAMPAGYGILRLGPEWSACFNERTLVERAEGDDFRYDGGTNAGEWIRDIFTQHLAMFPDLPYSSRERWGRPERRLPSLQNG